MPLGAGLAQQKTGGRKNEKKVGSVRGGAQERDFWGGGQNHGVRR